MFQNLVCALMMDGSSEASANHSLFLIRPLSPGTVGGPPTAPMALSALISCLEEVVHGCFFINSKGDNPAGFHFCMT